MRCPNCNKLKNEVIDSRPLKGETKRVRRRQCLKCGQRWTTHETIVGYDMRKSHANNRKSGG